MRYNELWENVKTQIKSKETYGKCLDELINQQIVKREEKNRKHVLYSISEPAYKYGNQILSLARRIMPLCSIELIADCMDFLVNSSIFSNEEEAVQAAIDFWVERYRNLCVLHALFSLMHEENNVVDVIAVRKSYQAVEDKFFDVILRFKNKNPKLFNTVLGKKLFLKGVDLRPPWLSMTLEKFLEVYYPEAYKKLGEQGKANIYFSLLAKQRETEHIYCKNYKKEYPKYVCRFCKFSKPSKKKHCKYQKIFSVREKIFAKYKHAARLVHKS